MKKKQSGRLSAWSAVLPLLMRYWSLMTNPSITQLNSRGLPKVRIYTSPIIGKGASMRDGMLLAKNEVLVYIDADILTYPPNIVELLSDPIIKGEADFVKSCFDRQAGRVTELVAKPLLSILFPDLDKLLPASERYDCR